MIGVLLITHSFLGNAFIQAVEQIVGPQKNLKAIDINGDFDHARKWDSFTKHVKSLDEGQGVLVMTDLFGSGPSNLAIGGLGNSPIEVVVGVNLPMILSVLEQRHRYTLEDLADIAKTAGQKDIRVASSFLENVPVQAKKSGEEDEDVLGS